MEKWKKEYNEITVPENVREKMEEAIMKAKETKKRAKRQKVYRYVGSAAAAIAIMLILPNTSQTVAAAMQQIPVLGNFFKVVTVRDYQVDEGRYMADVKVPEIVPEETDDIAGDTAQQMKETDGISEDMAQQIKETTDAINFDIQKVTDELIEEFKSTMEEFEDGYGDIVIDSEVLTDDEHWFSLDLMLYQGEASGYERHRHYTIDKTTGKRAELRELVGENYVEIISEEVKTQMRQRMAEDENVIYWVDYEDMPDLNFIAIAEDQDFYINKEGNIVICFDEYEVAPGYMGSVEFIIEK